MKLGKATLLSKRSRPIVAIVPADAGSFLDSVPTTGAENAASMRETGEGLPAGRAGSLEDVFSELGVHPDRRS